MRLQSIAYKMNNLNKYAMIIPKFPLYVKKNNEKIFKKGKIAEKNQPFCDETVKNLEQA